MTTKKAYRKLLIMLIGILLIIFLISIGTIDVIILPIYAYLLGLILVVYLIYLYRVLNEYPKELFKSHKLKVYSIIDYYSVFVYVIIIVQLLFSFVFFAATVTMSSMNPLLFENDRVIVMNGNRNVERFDIIVFEVDREIQSTITPEEDHSLWIKRVIGLPGDRIDYKAGLLYINDKQVYEPHLYDENGNFHFNIFENYHSLTDDFTMEDVLINTKTITDASSGKIPDDYYLLLGDNRVFSKDSEEIGLVHKDQIIGEGKYLIKGLFSFEKIGG